MRGSGKSTAGARRAIKFCLDNPGVLVVLGAENYPLLKRTQENEWTNVFTNKVPWDHLKSAAPLIIKKPTQTDKRVIFANGSQALFLHFNDPAILRGLDADMVVFEEACLLPDKQAFDELTRRLSGRKGPIRQLILLTNPDQTGGWISEAFKLKQKPRKDGTYDPIVPPCDCHLCQSCIIAKRGKFFYVDEEGNNAAIRGSKCSECADPKKNDCPGNQVNYRIVKTASFDNPHLPQDYVNSMMRIYGHSAPLLYSLREGQM